MRSLPRAAACSISFDDVPHSALENGVPILQRHGVPATFYVAAGLRRRDGYLGADDVRALSEGGFDIGCHTYSHYSLYAGSPDGLRADCERNKVAFREEIGIAEARDFSYPFGEVSVAAKRRIRDLFGTARSVYAGLNIVGSDLLLLRANALYTGRIDWIWLRAMLREAARAGAWIIFYTHGVSSDPDRWGCTPTDLERLVMEVTDSGIEFRSVGSVSDELSRRGQVPHRDRDIGSPS